MNGVEILAAHEVMATTFNWYVFIIGMGVIIGVISLLAWKYLSGDKTTNILVGLLCSLILFFPIGIIASQTGEKIPDHTEYKVQLSDEVPIAEFLSTYQIIDQEGQILTVIEKEFDE